MINALTCLFNALTFIYIACNNYASSSTTTNSINYDNTIIAFVSHFKKKISKNSYPSSLNLERIAVFQRQQNNILPKYRFGAPKAPGLALVLLNSIK